MREYSNTTHSLSFSLSTVYNIYRSVHIYNKHILYIINDVCPAAAIIDDVAPPRSMIFILFFLTIVSLVANELPVYILSIAGFVLLIIIMYVYDNIQFIL
jgi:hypothetical protein